MVNNEVILEKDRYDNIVGGIAEFTGTLVGIAIRYATSSVVPENDTLMKRVFRDMGSIALSGVAISVTTSGIKIIGACLKPCIVRK